MQNSKKTICFPCVLSTIYCLLLLFLGCGNNRHAVIAVTGTNIGVEISQNPANQTPQAKLGYQRSEIAIVPSNRSGDVEPGSAKGGAADVADVLMELKFNNIFSLGRAGVYQRLAVGTKAVEQSVFMFARDEKGKIDENTVKAIQSAQRIDIISSIDLQARIARLYGESTPEKKTVIEDVIKDVGFPDWNTFRDSTPSPTILKEIVEKLKEKGFSTE